MNFNFAAIPLPSSFSPRREWEGKAWEALLKELRRIPSPKEFDEILRVLISPSERTFILRRAAAITLLKKGASYRAIGRELWNSPRTIRALKQGLWQKNYVGFWGRTKELREEKQAKAFKKSWEKRNAPTGYYRRTKYGSRWTPS